MGGIIIAERPGTQVNGHRGGRHHQSRRPIRAHHLPTERNAQRQLITRTDGLYVLHGQGGHLTAGRCLCLGGHHLLQRLRQSHVINSLSKERILMLAL